MLNDPKSLKTFVLSWRAKKIRRVVNSSLAGEALAIVDTIGEIVYMKSMLKHIFGDRVERMPVIVMTDSQNLYAAVHSSSLVEDAWLIPDIACIQQALDNGLVTELKKVRGEEMMANCLTKKGAGAEELMAVLSTGIYDVPGDMK